jgi:hypothetical protein
MNEKINSHILKLQGKAELPSQIEAGHNFHVALEGSVPKVEMHDNEDGSWNKIYTFKAIKIELLTPKGETLKLKDTRSKSQLLRGCFWKDWNRSGSQLPFDEWYDSLMNNIIQSHTEIAEMYSPIQ